MRAGVVLAAALLALPLGLSEGAPGGCRDDSALDPVRAVPCGYIYPRLVLSPIDWPEAPPSLPSEGLRAEVLLSYEFDPMAEGLALDAAQDPIVVTFEFPKRPAWAALAVEPEEIRIPITPQYFTPDATDPANPGLRYRFEARLNVTMTPAARPVLPDGSDVARLFVFAKSTESGLYKPAYGIREFKVAPEGAIHEGDLGPRVALTPVEPPPFAAPETAIDLGAGLRARVVFEEAVELWRPARATVALEPASDAPVLVALVDRAGFVHAVAGPAPAPHSFNLTFPNAGEWRLVAFAGPPHFATGMGGLLLPEAGAGRGYVLPRDYRVLVEDSLDRANANAGDPASQDERVYPFPVFAGAAGAEVALALLGPAPSLDRSLANLNVDVLDPNGAVLQTGSVDVLNPAKRFPVGALPGPGLYRVRVYGLSPPHDGAPATPAAYRLGLQVVYDEKPLLAAAGEAAWPWEADGRRLGVHNATLAVRSAEPWVPTEVRLDVEGAGPGLPRAGAVASFAALDESGRPVFATGGLLRPPSDLATTLAFPRAGRYDLVAFAKSAPGDGAQWGRGFVVERVVVGDSAEPTVTYPTAFEAATEGVLRVGAPTRVGLVAFRAFDGAGPVEVALASDLPATVRALLLDADGREVGASTASLDGRASAALALDVPAPGDYTVVLWGEALPAAFAPLVDGATVTATLRVGYDRAISERNPLHAAPEDPPERGLGLPAAGFVLAAFAAALARRRRA